jgi:hypothetical protein
MQMQMDINPFEQIRLGQEQEQEEDKNFIQNPSRFIRNIVSSLKGETP